MKQLLLTSIIIYPIKSLGGISLSSAIAEERGLKFDRRWMLINENNIFISQRECSEMAMINVQFAEDGFTLSSKQDPLKQITIPFTINNGNTLMVKIWDDTCQAIHYNETIDKWFQELLGINCRLVYMPDHSRRYIDKDYAKDNEVVSFADGYPFLIIGEATLADLNNRLSNQIPMNRFRPNFVFSGGEAFEEDDWKKFNIGEVSFLGVKLCGRCVITTIDQETAERSSEPLKTLSTFRRKNNSVLFGQNLMLDSKGIVNVGDHLVVGEYANDEL